MCCSLCRQRELPSTSTCIETISKESLICKSFMFLMQLNVQQVDSYSKSVNDKKWMTIAIVEQQHNAGLRIMPSGAEDNTSDTTFLQFILWFILLSLLKVSWLSDQTQVLHLSICKGTTSCVMITLAKVPLRGLNFGSHGRPRYTRIRVITRRIIRRADCTFCNCVEYYRYRQFTLAITTIRWASTFLRQSEYVVIVEFELNLNCLLTTCQKCGTEMVKHFTACIAR